MSTPKNNRESKREGATYCPICCLAMVVRGQNDASRAYCCNCGSIFIQEKDHWHFICRTEGNNVIREYLALEDKNDSDQRS